jgi:HK97 family phage portal protein
MGVKNWIVSLLTGRSRFYSGGDGWVPGPNSLGFDSYIEPDSALTVSAVWRGINVLGNGLGMLPVFVYDRLPSGGKNRNPNHPLWRVLKYQPNPLQDSFQFFHMGVTHLILRGNFYCQIIRNGRGEILELWPLNPDAVTPAWRDVTDETSLMYKVTFPGAVVLELPANEVFHARTLTTQGVRGLSPIDQGMQTVATSLAMEEQVGAFFGKGVRASGVLQHPGKLSKEAADRLRKTFEDNYAGSKNAMRTILLEEGMSWQQVSLTNQQSQQIENREYNITDFCRWVGVPPHKVYDLRRATFSNIEHQSLEFLQDSLGPFLVMFERAMCRQLLPEAQWETTVIEFLVDALLRGDIKTRYEAYNVARNGGWMSADEIREKENMNPIPEGKGAVYWEPLNMKPLGEEEEPAPEEEEPEEPEITPKFDEDGEELQINAWKIVLESRVSRALRREITARQRQNSDCGRMLEYLPTDLKSDIFAILMFRASKMKANRSTFASSASMQSEFLAHAFAHGWVDRSEKQLDTIENWEESRAKTEVAILMGMIFDEYEGYRNEQ